MVSTLIKNTGRIMAIDYGDKRVGIAISDASCCIAQGHSVIDGENKTLLIDSIVKLVKENNISKIVVGLPRNMDGSYGFQSQKVMQFKELLALKTEIKIEFLDERLTTKEAIRITMEQGVKRKKRRELTNIISASLILENYLKMMDNTEI
jgi:putative holliday junction resolvase